MTLLKNLKQTIIALDQFINCVFGSLISIFKHNHHVWADETLSAYLWRRHTYWYINIFRILVDCVFFVFTFKWNHCERSFKSELEGHHLPESERKS